MSNLLWGGLGEKTTTICALTVVLIKQKSACLLYSNSGMAVDVEHLT